MSPSRAELPGVNLFGYLRAESGVGEHARTLLAALDEAGIPALPIDFGDTRSRRDHPLPFGAGEDPVFDLHLICVNADQTPHFVERFGADRLGTAHRIGYWHWEVEELPDRMAASAALVDEVWTASRHSAEAIRRKVDRPVTVLSPAVDPPRPAPLPAGVIPRGDGPLVLCCFDFDSVVERKNPLGAIQAFRRAFPAPGAARLLVKSVNGDLHPERLRELADATDGRADIAVVDRYLERGEQTALVAACDVFLSLHRAEGFGLMLAEAMWLAKPVVATAYSGNLEFMDETSGVLVPWRYAEIPPGAGPYSGRWAEPDLESAAAALTRLAGDREDRARLGAFAAEAVRARHGVAARGAEIAERLRALPARPPAAEPPPEELERLRRRILAGPDPNVPSVLGAFGRTLRRLALRSSRHAWLHQREVDTELLALLAGERRRARERAIRERALRDGGLRRLERRRP